MKRNEYGEFTVLKKQASKAKPQRFRVAALCEQPPALRFARIKPNSGCPHRGDATQKLALAPRRWAFDANREWRHVA